MYKKILAWISTICILMSMAAVPVNAAGDFTPAAEKIYGGHTYQLFDVGMTWEEAKKYCEEQGGHLVVITSQEEQNFITEFIQNGRKNGYWLGGYAKDKTSDFEWITGEPFAYTHWGKGQPDRAHQSSGYEDKIMIFNMNYMAGNDIGHWNDIVNEGAQGFSGESFRKDSIGLICEWDYVRSSVGSAANIPSDAKYFGESAYKIFTETLSWEQAKEYCEDLGGHLATITSAQEQSFIDSLNSGKRRLWIGGHRDYNNEWYWVTGEEWDYTNWAAGEPNNSSNVVSNENCAAVWPSQWNDLNENNKGEQSGFICEWTAGNRTSFGSKVSPWAKPEVEKAYDEGLIPETLIGADLTRQITRSEFAAISVKTYENLANTVVLPAINNPFTDTKDVEVLKAYNAGIAVGVSATKFSPNTPVTREQAATMLTRAFKRATIKGWTYETDAQFALDYKKPAPFADDSKISAWAKDSVYFMAANNIIKGRGNNIFAPRNTTTKEEAEGWANATREEALLIATRMVENLK